MDIIKAYEAYEAAKRRLKEMEEIEDFLLTEECGLVTAQIKSSIQVGSFVAVLDKEYFCWDYDMIYKSFTNLGYEVKKDVSGDIVIEWYGRDKA